MLRAWTRHRSFDMVGLVNKIFNQSEGEKTHPARSEVMAAQPTIRNDGSITLDALRLPLGT